MDSAQQKKLLTLKETAERLSVTVETLLSWNEHHILKPTITLEGEIGYTEEQIDQFLTIQRLVAEERVRISEQVAGMPSAQIPALQEEKIEKSISPVKNQLAEPVVSQSQVRIASVVGAVFLIVSIAFFSQQNLMDLFARLEKSEEEHVAKVSKSELLKDNLSTPIGLRENESGEKNLHAVGDKVLKEQGSPLNVIFSKVKSYESANRETQALGTISGIATVAGKITGFSTFASRISHYSGDSEFDENGNIKGDAKDTLATTLGSLSVANGVNSVNKVEANPVLQVLMLAVGLLSLTLVFPKKFSYAGKGSKLPHISVEADESAFEKVIEVEQKTDGTIIISLAGKEFKVSKPELYSESDQFIERLMEITKPGIKEIEYEVLRDEKIKLTTPLSRLVTRLGFVGIKRDLFFPRTSKDRVMFRRHLSKQDLSDMNLSPEQIISEITSIN